MEKCRAALPEHLRARDGGGATVNRLSALQRLLLRNCASVLSRGGAAGALLVLTYHRVLAIADPLLSDEPDAGLFAAQMDLVRDLFNTLTVTEAVRRLRSRSLPARAVCITFDDGYLNNASIAAQILTERGMSATFFVATGFLGTGRMWNDTVIEALRNAPAEIDLGPIGLGRHPLPNLAARRRLIDTVLHQLKYLEPHLRLSKAEALAAIAGASLPQGLMMSESDVRKLAALGMEIGAHSVTHPILTRLDDASARSEIENSKFELQDIAGEPVRSFAYPNGRPGIDYFARHVKMVGAAGFETAVSTSWGAATAQTDPFQIPRIAPWDQSAVKYASRMLRAYVQRQPLTV